MVTGSTAGGVWAEKRPATAIKPEVGDTADRAFDRADDRRNNWQLPIRGVAWIVGFLLFFPAFGIPIASRWIQPLDLVAVPALLIAIPSLLQVRARAAVPVLVTMLSWTASVVLGREPAGMTEVLFYFAALGPILLCSTSFLDRSEGRQAFIGGFLAGGLVSTGIGLLQGIVGGSSVIDFRTNQAFNLLAQPGRSMAFFPEASAFAATTAVHAACLVLYRLSFTSDHATTGYINTERVNTGYTNTERVHTGHTNTEHINTDHLNTEQAGANPKRNPSSLFVRFAPALVLADLLAVAFARSTSTLLLTPVLLLLGFKLMGYSAPKALKRLLLIGPVVALAGYLFIAEFYSTRFANRDAFNSIETRLSTILAAIGPLRDGQLFGVGVGNNDLAEPYIIEASRARGLRAAVTTGITSLLGQRVFEEGIGAIVSVGTSLAIWTRGVLSKSLFTSTSPIDRLLALFSGGMLMSFVFVSGYRGLYTSWMWLPVAGALVASSSPWRRSHLPLTETNTQTATKKSGV